MAEAQLELANEYGFRTWADLRAEVDRLRARSKVADPNVAAQVADAFDLGTVTGEMVPVERAWAGEVWLLPSDRGRWRATALFPHSVVVEDVLEDEVRLVEAACSAGIIAPIPVRARGGSVLATVEHRRWRVHEAIKLGSAPVTITPELARTAGQALGVLHRLALPTDRSSTAPPSAPIQARWLSSQPTEQAWWNSPGVPGRQTCRGRRLWATIPTLVHVASVCRSLGRAGDPFQVSAHPR